MARKVKSTAELATYQNHYNESKFWATLSKAALKVGRTTTYYILVLYYVLTSTEVTLGNKSIICGALGYLILPFDLLPDAIPLLGFTDDAAAIKLAYDAIKVSVTPAIENKANAKLDQWFKQA